MTMDTLTAAKIRLMANACITRYDRGEGTIDDILSSYNIQPNHEILVKAQITEKRPDLSFVENYLAQQTASPK